MQGRAAEVVLFGEGGEGRGGRVGRDAEDEVVIRVDILFQAETSAVGREGLVGQVEIAAAGDLVGEEIAAGEVQFLEGAVLKAAVEDLVGMALDGEGGVFEEGEIGDVEGVLEVDEDGNAFSALGLEDGGQQAGQAEGGEASGGGVHAGTPVRVRS